MALAYLKDPAAIYRQSFATIRREVDLSRFTADEAAIATRVIHACGMTDVIEDITFGGDPAGGVRNAVTRGKPVFVDVHMVEAALLQPGAQPGHIASDMEVCCTLREPATLARAARLGTTRSAAAVHDWTAQLAGSVVVIGNAPTALFALLDLLDEGAPKPAAIFAFPVGFVGAVESKAELIANPRGLNFVTMRGRRGGSAMAAAAFNAVWVGAQER